MKFYQSKTIKAEDIKVTLTERLTIFDALVQLVRIEHIPTGIIARAEDRSQFGAYRRALMQLEEMLDVKVKDKKDEVESIGIMRLLKSTFEHYKVEGHDNIYDPLDNALAGVNYMFNEYGKIVDLYKEKDENKDVKKEAYDSLMSSVYFKSSDKICEPRTNNLHRYSNDELIEELKGRLK